MADLTGRTIALVGINFEPETTGIAPYTTAMARALTEAGALVHVITGVPHYPSWKVTDSKYRSGRRWEENVGGIRVTRVRHFVPANPDLVGRARMELSFLLAATREVRKDRSDILIGVTPSMSGIAATVLGGRKRAAGVHIQDLTGNGAEQSGTTGGRVGRAIAGIEYFLLRRFKKVGVITPRFAHVAQQHGVNANSVVMLPNFTHISPVTASKREARARLGWPQDKFIAVHTGNMGRKQGLETVVEAARLSEQTASDQLWVLVGDGNQRTELEDLGRGVGSLMFVSPLSDTDYPYALAAADVLLLNERQGVLEMSLPSKLTSYSIAGRPILAAVESGGTTHELLADNDAAVLVDPGQPAELVAALKKLSGSNSDQAEYANKALTLHQTHYSAAAAYDRYVKFALSLLPDAV